MIQEIGLMVGIYIIIRLLRILIPPEGIKESGLLQVFTGIAIFAILVLMVDLLVGGAILRTIFQGYSSDLLRR